MGFIHQPKIEVDGYSLRELDARFDFPHDAWFHKAVIKGKIFSEGHDHELPSTLFWDFLKERYEIAPVRFTHWHPLIGHLIREEPVKTCLSGEVTVCTLPPNPTHCVGTVPEPSAVILLSIGLIFGGMLCAVVNWLSC